MGKKKDRKEEKFLEKWMYLTGLVWGIFEGCNAPDRAIEYFNQRSILIRDEILKLIRD